jgi:hypothetical protein
MCISDFTMLKDIRKEHSKYGQLKAMKLELSSLAMMVIILLLILLMDRYSYLILLMANLRISL